MSEDVEARIRNEAVTCRVLGVGGSYSFEAVSVRRIRAAIAAARAASPEGESDVR